ncbi:transcription elongation factor GreA [[Mycoplasma] testudinis]|uniref:transcription elongation factor GreA n=1 Tax=[Mycoplasma] testudinis TaxID=33924 RepID=UPI00048113C1|nr:transcription elongation factor GreA [[Mycoplasma] testudinis]
MASNKNLLTATGKKNLEEELRYLVDVRRPEIIKLIQEAREQGDLSENADYDAAKSSQGEIESRIKEIQDILSNVEIIKESKNASHQSRVRVGTHVEIYDHHDKKNYSYEIVGAIEADPSKNKISNESPLAKAIIDKKEGDDSEVRGIEIPYTVTIKKIRNN